MTANLLPTPAAASRFTEVPVTLLGVPSSAGAHGPGQEQAPAALRALDLPQRLRRAGVDLADAGDLPEQRFQATPRIDGVRAVDRVVAAAETVADAVSQIRRDGRLPLLIGGDCTLTIGAVAGLARTDDVGLFYFDGDADLSTPDTSDSGVLDSMGLAHLLGLGAPPLARIGPRYPLLAPDHVALFGFDPGELDTVQWQRLAERRLSAHPAASVRADPAGAAAAALAGLEAQAESILVHFDVDALDSGQIPLADYPHFGGLTLDEAAEALKVLVRSPKLAGLAITEINPDHDPDRSLLRDFTTRLVAALTGR